LPAADLPNCIVPVRVTGPVAFNLLAVWTWPAPSYIKAFLNGLHAYSKLLRKGPAVVAGDFNGNPVFDKPGHRLKWSDGFSKLHEAGLVSAYHLTHRVAYGAERDATHHFLRKAHRPFHIDFCFVPGTWAEDSIKAEVVHGPEWSLLSDHFPLLVSLEHLPGA
jgi:endonuclease/exonuclease/phosphatase family metal-dependent hydrolase